jgi:hypothetical protein
MRAYLDTYGREGGHFDHTSDLYVAQGRAVF